MAVDSLLFSQAHNFVLKNFWFDTAVIFFAKYLPYILAALLFLFLLKDYKKYWQMVLAAFVSAGLASVITIIIRFFYYRPRPFVLENIIPLFSHSASGSFPSLHSAFFFALSAALILYNKKLASIFFAASLLIVFSRIIAGLHWPGDILAGLGLGIASALLIRKVLPSFIRLRGL